jgi:hypothetical protein
MSTKCGRSSCDKSGVHLCAGCGSERYCSKECQTADYANHKQTCQTATKPETASMLQSFKGLSPTQLKNLIRAKAKSYPDAKRKVTIEKLDKITEKDHLIKFVEEHVHPAETESLLSGGINPVSPGSSSGAGKRLSKGQKNVARMQQSGQFQQNGNTPSPEMVLKQCADMRKYPDQVRRSNKMFEKWTNAQIFAYADQMESAAKNPEMFKQMMEMSNMPEKDRKSIQLIQQGIAGEVTRDEKWIRSVVKVIKSNPDLLKTLYKPDPKAGITDEQTAGFIDAIVSMPDWLLIIIGRAINWCVDMWPTITAMYKKVDDMTLGCAKYLVMAIAFFLLYQIFKWVWWIMGLVFTLISKAYNMIMGSAPTVVSNVSSHDGIASATSGVKKAAAAVAGFDEEF